LAAQQFCEELTHATTTILHVGINDLNEMSVEEAFEMYEIAVDKLLEKSDADWVEHYSMNILVHHIRNFEFCLVNCL
jgi:hypothetical protein